MASSRLRRAGRLLGELRRRTASIKARELISIAQTLGRKADTTRGKEPTYDFEVDYPWSRALTIPKHGGRDLPVGTACSILNQLEGDLEHLKLEEISREKANGAGQNGSNGAAGA